MTAFLGHLLFAAIVGWFLYQRGWVDGYWSCLDEVEGTEVFPSENQEDNKVDVPH